MAGKIRWSAREVFHGNVPPYWEVNLKPVTFSAYHSIATLAQKIDGNPKAQPLAGLHVVVSGRHPNATRSKVLDALSQLGATTSDCAGAVRPGTFVFVAPWANSRWVEADRAGRKLQRAEKSGALVFRMSDLAILLRARGADLPQSLAFHEPGMPPVQLLLPLQ